MQFERRLIFGCGYLGRRVAKNWLAQGHFVAAVTRSNTRAMEFAREAITPFVVDIAGAKELPAIDPVETVLFSVGFDRSNNQSVRDVYVGGLRKVLRWLEPSPPSRLVYISSTGVYGDCAGEWVTEESRCEPERENGKACLEAESLLAESPWRERSVVLRLGGLYGPGRLPNRKDLLAGAPIKAAETGFLNLIHADDAAAAVDLVLSQFKPPRTYNVTDGSPVVRGDYYREFAKRIGAPEPKFDLTATSNRTKRATADKRVSSERIMQELGFRPRHANYCEGIAAVLREEKQSDQ